jgi:outer membrane protein OmpA-like peptidoglycan-associated protein
MSRFDRRLVADLTTLSVLMLFLLLAACGRTTGSDPQAIVVMASATANEPGPVLASGDAALLYHAGAISTDVVAYVMDPNTGQPTRVPLTPRRPDGQVDWGPGRGERLAGNVSRVQQLLNREAATKPFDLLAEISAARRVTSSPATLIVVSSGLSTAGALDMRQVGWDVNPAAIAAQLKHEGLLPDLTGWHVIFSGLGDTAGRQSPLPLPQRTTLTALWTAICRAARAESCTADEITRPERPSRSTTPVPVVQVPRVVSIHAPDGSTTEIVPTAAFFVFNSAQLLPDADAILSPVATEARTHHLAVSVTGYASPDGGTDNYNNALSARRAIAVAARLMALGIPAHEIINVIGEGTADETSHACYRRNSLDETVCGKLRRVVILLSPLPAASH